MAIMSRRWWHRAREETAKASQPGGNEMDADEMDAAEYFFVENGYCVIPDVLSPREIAQCYAAALAEQKDHPEDWRLLGRSRDGGPVGESGRWQTPSVCHHTDCFDVLFGHPKILPMVRRLMGPDVCIQGPGSLGVRAAVHEAAPKRGSKWPEGTSATAPWPDGENILWQMWHREQGGLFLPSHPNCIHSLQIRVQLNDTDKTGHTFSTVPESVAQKKQLPWVPQLDQNGEPTIEAQITGPFMEQMWRNRYFPEGVDVCAKAGSVVLVNNSNIHAGTVRSSPTERVDFRFDFGHKSLSSAIKVELASTEQMATGTYSRDTVPERLFQAYSKIFNTEQRNVAGHRGRMSSSPAPYNSYGRIGGGHFVAAARLPQRPAGNLDWEKDGGDSMRRLPQPPRL